MTINVEFWHLVGLLLSFLGCCFGFAKILVAQFQNSLSERHQNQLRVNEKVDDLERQINQMNSQLPLIYVLHEDYIRGQTKQGFAIIRGNNGWEYIADFRGKTCYDKITKAEVTISELGEIPENLTALKPGSELCEWNGSAWVIDQEKQAAYLAQKQTQLINDIDNKATSIYSVLKANIANVKTQH